MTKIPQDEIKAQLVTILSNDVERKAVELDAAKKLLNRIQGGEALPELQKRDGRWIWYCRKCGEPAGANIFIKNIPFAADSLCKKCESSRCTNLNDIE